MSLELLLNHPAFQSSVVPLLASMLVAAAFLPLRLSGIGVAGGSDFGMKYGIPALADEIILNVSFLGFKD